MKTEAILQAAVEAAPTAILLADAAGRIGYANPAFARLWGYADSGEVLGKQLVEACGLDMAGDSLAILVKEDQTWTVELKARRRDGIAFYVQATFSPARNETAEASWLMAAFVNITEKRQKEIELYNSEALLRKIIATSPNCIFVKNQEGAYVLANPALAALFGLKPEEMIGMTDHDIIARLNINVKVADQLLAECREIIHNRESRFLPNEYLRLPDGTRRWFQSTKVPLELNRVWHMLGISVEITRRKEVEEALRESEEKYRKLVENAREAIFITQDGVIKFPNPTTIQASGYSADELARMSFMEFVHPDDREMVSRSYDIRQNADSLPEAYSFRIINRRGERLWVQLNAVRIQWEGKPALLNFLRDVTEQKRIEARLQYSHRMETVAALAGGIAHQFNNILTGITGNIELIRMFYPDHEKINKYLTPMLKSAQKMSRLTNELLAYARGEQLKPVSVSVNELVRTTLPMLQPIITPGIGIVLELAEGLEPVKLDFPQVQMVFTTIFTNAVEAIDAKGEITIATRRAEIDPETAKQHPGMKPGSYVCLSVRDNGKGMDEKTTGRIFDPFFTTKFQGRGMGMASAYRIIKNHHGWIGVDSRLDEGTEVRVYLPARQE